MSIESIYADGIEASVQRQLKNPGPAPETSFSTAMAFRSFGTSQVSGWLKTFGNVSDLLSGAATPYAASMYGDEEATKNMLTGNAFDVTAGNVLRSKAEEFVPSPESSHWANVAIHGALEFIPKAVGAVATMGPAGAIPLGLDAGNTATQNLRSKGIDTATATEVGAIEGVAAGVGAVLPIGAATKLGTAAFVAGGGPGLFMAQEQASKKILERAGYMAEAEGHDPLDWRGLVMSAIPGIVIGGLHARNLGKIPQVSAATEGAMKTASALTPSEQAHSDAYERSSANLDELKGEIARQKDPAIKATLQAELDKQTAEATKHANDPIDIAASNPDIVDAARVKVTNDALHRNLPDTPNAYSELMRASDEIAAGRMPDVEPMETTALPEFKQWFGESKVMDADGNPLVVYHGTNKVGRDGLGIDSFKADDNGLIFFSLEPREANRFAEQQADYKGVGGRGKPNVLPVYVSAKNPFDFENPQHVEALLKKARIDPSSEAGKDIVKGDYSELETKRNVKAIKALGFDAMYVRESTASAKNIAVFEHSQIKSAIGNSGKFDPNSASLTDPLRPGERNPRSEGTNALHPDSVTLEPEIPKASAEVVKEVGPSSTKSADIQATVEMRKRQSVLKSILECLS